MLTTYAVHSSEPTEAPLIFLHAFPLSSAMWAGALTLLAERAPERDYYTIEFPGFGESQSQRSWTMEQFAEEIKMMLDSLGVERAILAGISVGGYAALAFYRAFPNRTAGLVLSNTQAAADTEEAKRGREEFVGDVELRGSLAASERMLPKFLVPQVILDQPDLKYKLEYWIQDAKPDALIAALRAMALRPDSTDLLNQIAVPTLVIAGSEDAFFSPSVVRDWSKKIPNCDFQLIEGAGHLSPLDKPHEWAQAVTEFLRNSVKA